MEHTIIASGSYSVDFDTVESVIWRMEEGKKRANSYKAEGRIDLYDMEVYHYLGMKQALEMLELIHKKDVEF